MLEDMEQHLLQLDPDAPDQEQLNAIFRSAHSIKGGGCDFWFYQATANYACSGKFARQRQTR
ncbi:Hpt domain-containing protein [Photorhabdus temperata]|uniref:Hpt domain-containing protein n=1 Tax=Photorhabdus temperata TaxID=574560 RepID=UPI000418CEFA